MIFGDGEYDRDMDIAVNRREAWEEGREEEKLLIARNLLEKSSSLEFVYEITGLSLDEINALTR
jgi:predicted transposase/invertase (TIGR01784 family)